MDSESEEVSENSGELVEELVDFDRGSRKKSFFFYGLFIKRWVG